jgi:hypothetical protein
MTRTRTHVGEAELFQDRSDIALVKVNTEPFLDDGLQINTPPANNAIYLMIRSSLDDGSQFGSLFARQPGLDTSGMAVQKSFGAKLIEAMDPVTQGLPVHAANTCGIGPVHAINNRRKRQQTPALVAVLCAFGEMPKMGGAIVCPQG